MIIARGVGDFARLPLLFSDGRKKCGISVYFPRGIAYLSYAGAFRLEQIGIYLTPGTASSQVNRFDGTMTLSWFATGM